ncbi:MAG: YkgJ family cysteine cluster protein [Candidatus Hermodarchaeota archaeon]
MKKILIPCLRCGRCCRIYAVTITQAELEILSEYLNSELNLPRFCTYCDTIVPASENPICPKCGAQMKKYLFKDDNERCPYLTENASGKAICRIYLYRPQECRRFLCIYVPPHLRIH